MPPPLEWKLDILATVPPGKSHFWVFSLNSKELPRRQRPGELKKKEIRAHLILLHFEDTALKKKKNKSKVCGHPALSDDG